jgi:2-C-methyl-D-erythritol 4-phosphate cytidylyltransferase
MKVALVIPAAGVGARMQADRPKQYLTLAGQSILEVTAQRLLDAVPTAPLFIAISAADPYFAQLAIATEPRVTRVVGGRERADSVLSALNHIDATAYPWVLVHDAARPLLRLDDLNL